MDFAKKHQFDPEIGENWYKVSMSMLTKAGVCTPHFFSISLFGFFYFYIINEMTLFIG
jgi:hypothetical protein